MRLQGPVLSHRSASRAHSCVVVEHNVACASALERAAQRPQQRLAVTSSLDYAREFRSEDEGMAWEEVYV